MVQNISKFNKLLKVIGKFADFHNLYWKNAEEFDFDMKNVNSALKLIYKYANEDKNSLIIKKRVSF